MIVRLAASLARLRRVNPAVAEAVARCRDRRAKGGPARPRPDAYPRLFRPPAD